MAADDAKAASKSANLVSSAVDQFHSIDDSPLPALPTIPPMPVFGAGLVAAARVTRPVAKPIREVVAPASASAPPVNGGAANASPVAAEEPPAVPEAKAVHIKGWVSLDADLVFRGWAMNVGASDQKLEVSLYIDDELIAQSVAEDFRADLPGVDKRHGFKFVIPTRFVDSIEHRWVVRAGASNFQLNGNTATFVSQPEAIPVISVRRIARDTLSGTIECAALTKCGNPNIWIGDVPLEVPADIRVWNTHGRSGSYPFDVPLDVEHFISILTRGLRVSIPGDRAGARALQFEPPIAWKFNKDALQISVGGPFDFGSGVVVPVSVGSIDGDDVSSDLVRFSSEGVADLKVSSKLVGDGFRVVLGGAAAHAAYPFAQYEVAAGLLSAVENWDFGSWHDNGVPSGWDIPDGIRGERRFASASRTGMRGSAEDTVLLWPDEAPPRGQPILRRSLRKPIQSRLFAGLVARAAQKCRLEIAALDEDGAVVASQAFNCAREWQKPVLEIPAGDLAIRTIELRLLSDGVRWVELAGLDLAGDAGFLFLTPDDATPAQVLANPTFQDWGHATYPIKCATRTELARGWWAASSKGTELIAYPVPLPVLAHGADPAHFALAVSGNAISKFARIEASIQPRAFQSSQTYSLKFNASAASQIDGSPVPRHRKWPVIDRIFVMTRDRATGVGRFLFDCGRRIPLPVTRTNIDIRFEVDAAAGDVMMETQDELMLVLEFHSAFQITLDSFSVDIVGDARARVGAAIALEDGDITAQASTTKGCEHWVAPTACKWGGDGQTIAPSSVEPVRWSWNYRDLGTVEVVICVYNAIDETLQCLQSLTQSTGVPHTVSIIDDGSNANGVARLEAFIRDKPWMRIHTNAANKGYTRSADFGIRSAGSDWVVLLNSDTVVSDGWLEGLLEVAASDPDISLVGPVSNAASFQSVPELYDAAGQWAANEIPAGMSVADMARLVEQLSLKAFPRVPLLNGFCTLIRRSVFVEIGGLDATAFPMGYGEENDMCLRARDSGHVLAVADHVYVHHIKSASFGKTKRSELSKAGNLRLREKHPTTDFAKLGREFGEVSALASLRQRLREALRERQARAGSAS